MGYVSGTPSSSSSYRLFAGRGMTNHEVYDRRDQGLAHSVAQELSVRYPSTCVLTHRGNDDGDDTDAVNQYARSEDHQLVALVLDGERPPLRITTAMYRICLRIRDVPGWSYHALVTDLVCDVHDRFEDTNRHDPMKRMYVSLSTWTSEGVATRYLNIDCVI
jgi:hypothetical protein